MWKHKEGDGADCFDCYGDIIVKVSGPVDRLGDLHYLETKEYVCEKCKLTITSLRKQAYWQEEEEKKTEGARFL